MSSPLVSGWKRHRRVYGPQPRVESKCLQCGATFVSVRADYCSSRCRAKVYRAARAEMKAAREAREARRDGL